MSIDKEEIRRKFKELFDCSLDFIYVNDLEGNFIDANDVTLTTLGYEREDLPNITFQNLLDEEQLKIAIENTKDLIKKGKQEKPGIFKLRTKEGNYVYIETYGIPIKKEGKVYAIFGIAKNITELVIAEKYLNESVDRYRALYENTPFAIILINSRGVIIECNPRTVELFGYKKNELVEKEFRILQAIQPKDIPVLLDLFKRMVSGEVLHRVDLQMQKKDRNLIWTNLQASLVRIGKEIFVQAIFHDIDQHKKEDLAIQEELERLKKAV